jgi:colicin import membrane protein
MMTPVAINNIAVRLMFVLGFGLFFLLKAATAAAQAPAAADKSFQAQKAQLAAQRQANNAQLAADVKLCAQRFAVSDCEATALARHRTKADQIRQLELAVSQDERLQRAQTASARLSANQSKSAEAALRKAAAASEPTAGRAPKAAPVPKAAPAPKGQAAAEPSRKQAGPTAAPYNLASELAEKAAEQTKQQQLAAKRAQAAKEREAKAAQRQAKHAQQAASKKKPAASALPALK